MLLLGAIPLLILIIIHISINYDCIDIIHDMIIKVDVLWQANNNFLDYSNVINSIRSYHIHDNYDEITTDMNNDVVNNINERYRNVCTSLMTMMRVQSKQVKKAQLELEYADKYETTPLRSLLEPITLYRDPFTCYRHGYEKVEISNDNSSLVYYSLYKNAHFQIICHLYHYHIQKNPDYCCSDNITQSNLIKNNCKPRCFKKVLTMASSASSSSSSRLPFTFVRHPIDRFISAYGEIEFVNKNLQYIFPKGDKRRFKEFIFNFVHSDCSEQYFSDHFGVQHVRPQIGTLFEAYKRERQSLKIYKFEKLNADWKRLIDTIKFPEIPNDFSQEKFPHVSSNDNSKVKSSAKAFLSSHYEKENQQFNNETLIGIHYLRAICRLYLADFLCFNYTLPKVCDDITNEINL